MHSWLQVEPFLLVPRRSGENERERRKELLRRRNEHIQLTGGPMGACLCAPHCICFISVDEHAEKTFQEDVFSPLGHLRMLHSLLSASLYIGLPCRSLLVH